MVKGYFWKFKVEYDQTFAAIIKQMVFKVFFAIAAFFNLDIKQVDLKRIFLYDFINQLIYIDIYKELKVKTNRNMLYKLLKILYKLKQLP